MRNGLILRQRLSLLNYRHCGIAFRLSDWVQIGVWGPTVRKCTVRGKLSSEKSISRQESPLSANFRLKRHRFDGVFLCPLCLDISYSYFTNVRFRSIGLQTPSLTRRHPFEYTCVNPLFFRASSRSWASFSSAAASSLCLIRLCVSVATVTLCIVDLLTGNRASA